MAVKLYVGNLSFRTETDALRNLFAQFGEVVSASVVTDRESGRSRGFGFVEMADKEAADAAQNQLNGKDFEGRALTVNEARPRAAGSGFRGGDGRSSAPRHGGDHGDRRPPRRTAEDRSFGNQDWERED